MIRLTRLLAMEAATVVDAVVTGVHSLLATATCEHHELLEQVLALMLHKQLIEESFG